MAGHSKWANIQHRKGRQDKLRSKLFSKLSKEITVAAKMGDPDPEKNPRLRLAVKEAKSNSVPKDVIDRAIGKATGGDDENRYEGYGPNGVAVIVEAMTDNKNRTASSVRSLFTKSGGNLAETGAVSFMFERKGLVVYGAEAGDVDAMFEHAIDAGAEDVESTEDGHDIYCASTDLNDVSKALELALGESATTKLIWKPTTMTELDLSGAEKIMRLIENLEDDDDIQNVTTNMDVSDEIMSQL